MACPTGRIAAGSIPLARSGVGIAVRASAPKPDIGRSPQRALLDANRLLYQHHGRAALISPA